MLRFNLLPSFKNETTTPITLHNPLKYTLYDVLPNAFIRDLNVGPKMKQQKKKIVGARSLIHNILGVGRHARAPDGIRTNSQARVQNEVNLHNIKNKVINAN